MKTRLAFITALILFIGFGCHQTSPPSENEVVRVAYPPIVAALPMFVAEHDSLDAAEGIDFEEVQFTSSNDMINALAAGQIEMLPAVSLVPILHLEIQQPGIVKLFSHSRMRPDRAFDSIIARSDSEIMEVEDLADMKIGVFPGTSASNMLKVFLSRRNVDLESVTLVPLAPPAQLASLESGAIDALFTYEPITTVALRRPEFRRVHGSVYAALQDPNPIGASVIATRLVRENPEVASKAIKAIDAAVLRMREHPEETQALLPEFTSIESDLADDVNVVDVTLSNEIDVAVLQQFIDLMAEVGETPRSFDARLLLDDQ